MEEENLRKCFEEMKASAMAAVVRIENSEKREEKGKGKVEGGNIYAGVFNAGMNTRDAKSILWHATNILKFQRKARDRKEEERLIREEEEKLMRGDAD